MEEKQGNRQGKMIAEERGGSEKTAPEAVYGQAGMIQDKVSASHGPEQEPGSRGVSETWAEETIADLDDFIESQGIYIRQ